MKTYLIVCCSLLAALPISGATLHVPSVFPTIQLGIDASSDGDTVLVAGGTYSGHGNRDIDFRGKAIVVRSSAGPDDTIIDCGGKGSRGFVFENDEGPDSKLEGFTVREGYNLYGAGIYCRHASPVILDCIVRDNVSMGWHEGWGAGIFLYNSDAEIRGCRIEDNYATEQGGGIVTISMSFSAPEIVDCVIAGNEADQFSGGGIYAYLDYYCTDTLLIDNCEISRNVAEGYSGGGLYCGALAGGLLVRNTEFSDNSAYWGSGGVSVDGDGICVFENCLVSGNSANDICGGIRLCSREPVLRNCIIESNISEDKGGGIYCKKWSRPLIQNCTILKNSSVAGSGIYCETESFPILSNCILWNNIVEEETPGEAVVTYCDIQGGWPGEGNIDRSPRFIPFAVQGFEYLLRPSSPCIDAGDPSIEDALCDLHPRWPEWYPNGPRSDMGAYGGPGNRNWLK